MTDARLTEMLAAAVADHESIDAALSATARRDGPTGVVDAFRVIAQMGAARRAEVDAVQQQASRALRVGMAVVGALALAKLSLALTGLLTGLARVPLASLRWPFALNLALFGSAGAVLVVGGSRDRRLRALGVIFLVIASAFAAPLMPRPDVVAGQAATLVRLLWDVQPDAFLALAIWMFVWQFPNAPRQRWARRAGAGFLVASAAVGAGMFLANVLGSPALAGVPAALRSALSVADRSASTLVYWPLVAILALPAFPYLLWKSRVDTRADQRRASFFVGALACAGLPMLVAVLLTPAVPVLQDPVWRDGIGLALYIPLLAAVPATAYAVAVSHVLDLHLVFHRTLQYALARSTVWVVAVGPLVLLVIDLYRARSVPIAVHLEGPGPQFLLVLSLVGFLVLTFRHQIQQRVDRWFLREAADYTETLARLDHGLRSSRSIREIALVLRREMERAVHPGGIDALMLDEQGGLVSLDGMVPRLPRESVLLQLLRSVGREVILGDDPDGPVRRLLPASDRRWLAETAFRLFTPLVGSAGAFLGVVGLGPGQNGLPYTRRDTMLLAAMCGQAALKLENSRLREQPSHTLDWSNEPAVRCPECHQVMEPSTPRCACGAATVEAALPRVVKGKFRVEAFVGAGGAGVVYRAVDLTLDRQVAIKTLPAIRLKQASRLHREARAMASVLHPNLALIYGAEQWKGTPLLVFEYLEGGTLLDSLRQGPVALDEVLDLGTLLADALDRVHASGVMHRDIKPSNIGYTLEGVPKLLDFGLATILDRSRDGGEPALLPADPVRIAELAWGAEPTASLTVTQQLVGTPLYLSPEALNGQPPAPSFDLWSLALVLYQAYAGRHPLAGLGTLEVVTRLQGGALPDIRDLRADCPPAFSAFLNDALSPVAARRPQSAADLRTELRALRARLFHDAA